MNMNGGHWIVIGIAVIIGYYIGTHYPQKFTFLG